MKDLKFITKKRGMGKTTMLIYASAATGIPIVANSKKQCEYIADKAREYEVSIPKPVTPEEVCDGRLAGTGVTELFADDAEELIADALREYLGRDVVCVTLTDKTGVQL